MKLYRRKTLGNISIFQRKYDWFIRKTITPICRIYGDRRMKGIGLEPKYDQKTNPLPWVEHWLNSRSTQNAPQETEIESYVIGGIKQDVKKDQFKKSLNYNERKSPEILSKLRD